MARTTTIENRTRPEPAEGKPAGAELAALGAAVGCLEADRDLEAAAQDAIEVLEQRLGYENLAVLAVDEPSERLRPIALSDQQRGRGFVELDKIYVESANPGVDRGVTGWVAANGHSVRLADVRDDRRYVGLRDEIRSEVCVPIRSADHVLGVINAETPRPNAFTETDQQVLEVLASRLGPELRAERSQAADRRSERLESLGQMTGGVAHDMNNLLTTMVARVELMEKSLHSPDVMQEHFLELKHAHDLAASMTHALLDFARGYPSRQGQVDVNRIVRQALRLVRWLLPPSVFVETRLEPELAAVFAGAGDIERLLFNLMQNAHQAMSRGGNLIVSTANVDVESPDDQAIQVDRPGTHIRLAITDDGEGMDKLTLSRLFRPLHTSRPRGHGLGLSTVKQIVERYSGHIEVHSERGLGTRFEIYLPRATPSAD